MHYVQNGHRTLIRYFVNNAVSSLNQFAYFLHTQFRYYPTNTRKF